MNDPHRWAEDKMIDGVTIRGNIPVVGNGCWRSVGSDNYGYRILEVSSDGKWFSYGKNGIVQGYAAFITRKNSLLRGRYAIAKLDKNGKFRPLLLDIDIITPTDRPGEMKDEFDPSF